MAGAPLKTRKRYNAPCFHTTTSHVYTAHNEEGALGHNDNVMGIQEGALLRSHVRRSYRRSVRCK